jgi:hypothetical protein
MQRVQRECGSLRVVVDAELASPRRWRSDPSCPGTVAHPTGSLTWGRIRDVLRGRAWLPEFSARLPEEDLAE